MKEGQGEKGIKDKKKGEKGSQKYKKGKKNQREPQWKRKLAAENTIPADGCQKYTAGGLKHET